LRHFLVVAADIEGATARKGRKAAARSVSGHFGAGLSIVAVPATSPEEQSEPDLTPAERLSEAQWEVDHAVQIDDKR
jgi:hypothetical protein